MALAPNRMLTSVNLSYNRISDRGVEHLCEALQVNPVVTSLDLGSNSIGPDGANVLARFVASDQCKLKTLVVCSNPGFTDKEKALLRQAWGSRDAAQLYL